MTMGGASFRLSEEESNILNGCLRQDRMAQQALYNRYKDAMYTLARRIAGDEDLAADILQETFIAVFSGLKQFKGRSTLGAWIKTILVRTAYKRVRKVQPMQSLEPHHVQESVDWGHSLDVEYLEQAIQSLPPGYRSVFVLVAIEGYAHKEVAEMLSISEGTSKSQLFYAKRLLRKKISQLELVS